MSVVVTRNLSAYDGQTFMGSLKIIKRAQRCSIVKVRDRDGKELGTFKSQKAGIAAISRAHAKRAAVPR